VGALPIPFREVLVLREIHGLDYRAIAEVSAIPIGTVMSRLARARRLLLAAVSGGQIMSHSKEDELLVNAYLDGELPPLEADRFEQRLSSEPQLVAEIEAYRLLRAALRSDLEEDLRRAISAIAFSRGSISLAPAAAGLGALLPPPSSPARCSPER
jgi:hypothetical protein